MQNSKKIKSWFIISSLLLLSAIVWSACNQAFWYSDTLHCSTKAIMHFENPHTESVNANIHFNFDGKGTGSIVIEGYTDSASGWLYLQRYVKFDYTSTQISTYERYYKITRWVANKSSIDQSPDIIFDYFMREMSDSHDGLLLSLKKINNSTVLLGSINSPLYICNLKSGSDIR